MLHGATVVRDVAQWMLEVAQTSEQLLRAAAVEWAELAWQKKRHYELVQAKRPSSISTAAFVVAEKPLTRDDTDDSDDGVNIVQRGSDDGDDW